MTLGYLLGAAISDPDPEHGAALYDAFPAMRRTYDEVSQWTGLPARAILRGDFEPVNDHDRFGLNAVRLAALSLGIHDILADSDVVPGVVGGVSLGGLTGACIAGAVRRSDLFTLLRRESTTPPPESAPAQGAAIAFLPVDDDPAAYLGDDLFLAGDFGSTADGGTRLLMLSGTMPALQRAVDAASGRITVIDGQPFAVHSPLRRYAADHMAPSVTAMPISDPAIPLCSFLEQRTLTTADDVRELFQRNKTSPMLLPAVVDEMAGHGVRLGIVLGPTLPAGALRFPFPVVQITQPQHITEAMAAIYEYGVDLAAVPNA